jgi:UDP-N-acetyl-2-amino-2-deoxyglucuronate dehydrogenase
MALRAGADAICEKPLVLNPKNLDLLHEIESETGKRIYTVLQLRLHDAIKNLKSITYSLQSKANVDLTYITSRGKWYNYSWKGNEERSGGILSNIGIHFFDMLIWIFGKVVSNKVISRTNLSVTGELELERAFVKWKLSIDGKELPKIAVEKAQKTFRSISINGAELEFSEGFTDLHTVVYKDILNGGGYGIEDTRGAIELVYSMR